MLGGYATRVTRGAPKIFGALRVSSVLGVSHDPCISHALLFNLQYLHGGTSKLVSTKFA